MKGVRSLTSIAGVKLGVGKGQRIPSREKMSKAELPCWQGCLGEFSLTSVCSYCEDLKRGSVGSQMIKVCILAEGDRAEGDCRQIPCSL